jgi:hypothetical protein
MLIEAMDRLLRSVVPADVNHALASRIFVCPVYLRGNRLGEIVRVLNVYPVADFVELAIVGLVVLGERSAGNALDKEGAKKRGEEGVCYVNVGTCTLSL